MLEVLPAASYAARRSSSTSHDSPRERWSAGTRTRPRVGFDEQRPAGVKAAQRIVEACGRRDQLASVALSRSGPRKRAVRWNEPSF
jgi:hypothetical protein